jgi:hypothetical protein
VLQATTIRQTPQPYVVDPSAIPRTGADVQALRIKLRDLRSELQDAAERRNSVASRLRSADISARPGYEARLQALDSRILQLENEITRNDILLNQAPPAAVIAGTSQEPDPVEIFNRVGRTAIPVVAIISIFVLMPFAIAISRLIWKRATAIGRPPPVDHATQQRLDQLQQAVDTIAVEVERISEGQRFVTKLMSERSLNSGAAEPIRTAPKSAIPSERG